MPRTGAVIVSTQSASSLELLPESLDYFFFDPPFGANIAYSELNSTTEAWIRVYTDKEPEAIEDRAQKKDIQSYKNLISACFKKVYRALKPGRWMTVEFSNTQASIWNAIQTALQEAGFVVANVSALNKGRGGLMAIVGVTAVKQDLVISAYKPNGGLEDRFAKRGETEEGAWDFMRTHLNNLPVVKAKGGQMETIVERDPRILYDRMVAFYVGHSTPVPLSSAEFQMGIADKPDQFPTVNGMVFLKEQRAEYDKAQEKFKPFGQLSIFVEDERSAINWLRNFLKDRPSVSSDIHPEFMQQLGASWKRWEARPEMSSLLDQNFLCYDGTGDVPSQIHSYLSTQFKVLRNLSKNDKTLQAEAKNRWYVPDPKKNVDVENLRNKRLLEEFWSYLPEGYTPPSLTANKGQTLPGLTVPRPKIPKGKKLKELRTEAVRVGFKHCYQNKDYTTILVVAGILPESILNEDEQLQMIYDTAVTRSAE
jgi:DNA modification methylase